MLLNSILVVCEKCLWLGWLTTFQSATRIRKRQLKLTKCKVETNFHNSSKLKSNSKKKLKKLLHKPNLSFKKPNFKVKLQKSHKRLNLWASQFNNKSNHLTKTKKKKSPHRDLTTEFSVIGVSECSTHQELINTWRSVTKSNLSRFIEERKTIEIQLKNSQNAFKQDSTLIDTNPWLEKQELVDLEVLELHQGTKLRKIKRINLKKIKLRNYKLKKLKRSPR